MLNRVRYSSLVILFSLIALSMSFNANAKTSDSVTISDAVPGICRIDADVIVDGGAISMIEKCNDYDGYTIEVANLDNSHSVNPLI